MQPRHILLALLAPCCLTACAAGYPTTASGTARVDLSVQNLRALDTRHGAYEAWVVSGGKPTSLGKFLVSAAGAPPTTLDGKPLGSLTAALPARAIDEVLITQEAPNAPSALPSRQIFLRGMVSNGAARLEAPVAADRFAGKACTYILDNPATEKDLVDANGIWFAHYADAVYTPGLAIDPAPAGFMYSAWLELNGVPLRLGKFAQARENDDFYGYSGLNSVSLPVNFTGPPMPGEDFNANLPAGVPAKPDLAGAVVIVALESAALAGGETYPQPLTIFRGQVPTPGVARTNYTLENVAATSWPSGSASIQ